MIRSLLISVWIVSVTLAAAYFGHTMQSAPRPPGAEEAGKALTAVKLKSITVPVVADGALQGYVLTQLSISAKPDLLKNLPQPPDVLLGDEVFKTFMRRSRSILSISRKRIWRGYRRKFATASIAGLAPSSPKTYSFKNCTT